jgi:hypothetical protein
MMKMEEPLEKNSTKRWRFSILRIIGIGIILLAIIIGVQGIFYYNDIAEENLKVDSTAVRIGVGLGIWFTMAATMVAIFIGSLVWGFAIRRERKTIGVSMIEEIVHRIFFYPSALISMIIVAKIIIYFLFKQDY